MKAVLFAMAALCVAACDAPKNAEPPPPPRPPSVMDIPSPVNVPPPVDSVPFEDGYVAGEPAGRAAAKADPRPRKERTLPDKNQLAVIALEAAGADPAKGPKWQRGYISGFTDGFEGFVKKRR